MLATSPKTPSDSNTATGAYSLKFRYHFIVSTINIQINVLEEVMTLRQQEDA